MVTRMKNKKQTIILAAVLLVTLAAVALCVLGRPQKPPEERCDKLSMMKDAELIDFMERGGVSKPGYMTDEQFGTLIRQICTGIEERGSSYPGPAVSSIEIFKLYERVSGVICRHYGIWLPLPLAGSGGSLEPDGLNMTYRFGSSLYVSLLSSYIPFDEQNYFFTLSETGLTLTDRETGAVIGDTEAAQRTVTVYEADASGKQISESRQVSLSNTMLNSVTFDKPLEWKPFTHEEWRGMFEFELGLIDIGSVPADRLLTARLNHSMRLYFIDGELLLAKIWGAEHFWFLFSLVPAQRSDTVMRLNGCPDLTELLLISEESAQTSQSLSRFRQRGTGQGLYPYYYPVNQAWRVLCEANDISGPNGAQSGGYNYRLEYIPTGETVPLEDIPAMLALIAARESERTGYAVITAGNRFIYREKNSDETINGISLSVKPGQTENDEAFEIYIDGKPYRGGTYTVTDSQSGASAVFVDPSGAQLLQYAAPYDNYEIKLDTGDGIYTFTFWVEG